MDQHKLRNLVFEKTGVKVDSDDPIFALVALNEVVLAEAVGRHVALIDAATQELALQARACSAGPAPAARDRRLLACAAGIAVVSALAVLGGAALLAAPGLTQQQSTAIRNGEKLAKVVQTLDQKTRALIQAAMQKP